MMFIIHKRKPTPKCSLIQAWANYDVTLVPNCGNKSNSILDLIDITLYNKSSTCFASGPLSSCLPVKRFAH